MLFHIMGSVRMVAVAAVMVIAIVIDAIKEDIAAK